MKNPSWPDQLFAAWYDRLTRAMEEKAFRPVRYRLLADLSGRVLEIGVGTGANLPFYEKTGGEKAVRRIFLDFSRPMLEKTREKNGFHLGSPVQGSAATLPFPDCSFDRVVVTLVLCSVDGWREAISEIHRVLKPDGRLILLEHVRSDSPWMASLQALLTPLWKIPARGCHLDRPTDREIEKTFRWITRDRFFLSKTPFVCGILSPKNGRSGQNV